MNQTQVSVIIPSFNDATYVDRLLNALSKQNHDNFDVIVSDAESKDAIKDVISSYTSKLDLMFVQNKPAGPGVGRNQGAAVANGEWLLFLDADDDIDDPEFITKLVNETAKKSWATSTAKQKHTDASLKEKIGSSINYNYTKLLAHTKHPVAPGWCILTKRSVFEKVNGFDPDIRLGEDYDYVSRASRHGGFGFVESTYYYVDLRRAREEGWRLTIKAISNEVYRHTHRYKIKRNRFTYDFGKHAPRDSLKR